MVGVGSKLDGYELVAQLARGGMATLYVARRAGPAGFSRHVAVKVVHPRLARNPRFVDKLIEEAKLSVRVHHPNVVHVEELGEAEGTYYVVMELVHGCSLAQLLRVLSERRLRLSEELAVHVAIAIADGLHAAHETTGSDGKPLGIVHRDVSPQNVLLSYHGHVKLIDFGIARPRADETGEVRLEGKLRYMSPEQARMKRVDRRTDIYALGIVLWEMLTMRRLFRGADRDAVMERVRDPSIEPPSRHADGISPEVEQVVMDALAPSPDDRPETAQVLRRRLAEARPEALAIEASHLADLLVETMRDRIREQHEQLPESVTEVLRLENLLDPADDAASRDGHDAREPSAARTLTLDVPALEPFELESSEAYGGSPEPVADVEAALSSPPPAPSALRRSVPWVAAAALASAAIIGGTLAARGGTSAGESREPAAQASDEGADEPDDARSASAGPTSAPEEDAVEDDAGQLGAAPAETTPGASDDGAPEPDDIVGEDEDAADPAAEQRATERADRAAKDPSTPASKRTPPRESPGERSAPDKSGRPTKDEGQEGEELPFVESLEL